MTITTKKLVLSHIAFWLLYVTFAVLSFGYATGISYVIKETVFSYGISICVFYAHYSALKLFIGNKKLSLYVLALLAILAGNVTAKYIGFTYIWALLFHTGSSLITEDVKLDYGIIVFSWQASTFLILSAGYWFAERLLKTEREGRQKDRLELENVALRAQINPHFIVNSLGYIAGETRKEMPYVAEFANAMSSYAQSSIVLTNKNGLIELDEEIEALEALIFIQRRRFPEAVIKYEKNVPPDKLVAPHTLTPFVENAIKHGSFSDPEYPMYVSLELVEESLYFRCSNRKGRKARDKSRGIGLQYIKRQLESAFKGQYSLDIKDDEDTFEVNLRIDNLKSHTSHEYTSSYYR